MAVTATNIANLVNGVGGLEIDGAINATSFQIGSTTYLYVSAETSDYISVFELDALGVPTLTQTFVDASILNGVTGSQIVEVGDRTFLIATTSFGVGSDGTVSVNEVADDGTLSYVSHIVDDGTTEFDGMNTDPLIITMNGSVFVYVTGGFDDGLQAFSLANNGALTPIQSIPNSGNLNLELAFDLRAVEVAGKTFVVVAGISSDGVSVFEVGNDGLLTNTFNLDQSAGLALDGASAVQTVTVGSATFLYVAGATSDGVSAFQFNVDGTLTPVATVFDDADLQINGVEAMQSAMIGGTHYLAVSGFSDDGLTFFRVGNDGQLSEAFSIENGTDGALLDAAVGMEITEVDGVPYLYVTARGSDSVTAYRLNFPIAVDYNGSVYEMAETLAGAVELAAAGSTITVVDDALYSEPTEEVHVTRDNMTIDLGDSFALLDVHLDNFAFNIDITGNGSTTVYGSSANDETITSTVIDGDVNVFFGRGGEDVITSGESSDDLFGGFGDDILYGGEGIDYSFGGRGSDLVYGGANEDSVLGGRGTDSLYGGTGNDTMYGGDGADVLFGEDDIDRMFGGDGADDLFGGKGSDRMNGGFGADEMFGGDGADRIIGSNGTDTLKGGTGKDQLFGGNQNDALFGGASNDRLFGGNDNDSLTGSSGQDSLFGGAGDDTLFSGAGADVLSGGGGDNDLYGGNGADEFIYAFEDQFDVIHDFEQGLDTLTVDFQSLGFATAQDYVDEKATDNVGSIFLGTDGSEGLLLIGVDLNTLANDIEQLIL